MKKDIHKKNNFVSFACAACGTKYEIKSTLSEKEHTVDICGSCHPFYSGKTSGQQIKGRAEQFNKKLSVEKKVDSSKSNTNKKQSKKIVKSLDSL